MKTLAEIEHGEGGVPLPAGQNGTSTPPVLHFGNPQEEYQAATTGCAVFDVSDAPLIELSGRDRVTFLHNFCTADIRRLPPGEGCEAFLTDVRGRLLAFLLVSATEDSLWLSSLLMDEEAVLAHLDRYLITEDVTLTSRTSQVGQLYLSGAQSAAVLEQLGVPVGTLQKFGQHCQANTSAGELSVQRTDLLGPPGYLLSVARPELAALWEILKSLNARPAGAAAFHTLRIEAGLPLYGIDLSSEQIAQEAARTSRAISFTKGCYLGQEPIARLDALGHTNRELRGIRLLTPGLPVAGAAVRDETGTAEAGQITSASRLDDEQPAVALAVLKNRFGTPASRVQVTLADGSTAAGEVFWPLQAGPH